MSTAKKPGRRIFWAGGVLLLMLLVPPWTFTIEGRPMASVFIKRSFPAPARRIVLALPTAV